MVAACLKNNYPKNKNKKVESRRKKSKRIGNISWTLFIGLKVDCNVNISGLMNEYEWMSVYVCVCHLWIKEGD